MSLARVLVVAAVACLALPPLAAAQGLGDASTKEKQRRDAPAPKARTYTQDDLASLPPVANDPSTAASEPAAPPSSSGAVLGRLPGLTSGEDASADDEANQRARDEASWRSRVAEKRQRIEAARRKHATLANLNLVPGYEYADASGRTVIGSVGELQGLTARAKAELDAAEQALKDLLEEARHANVPPGWLR
jgi:hypothetical protein